MALTLILFPLMMAAIAFAIASPRPRALLLPASGAVHLALVVYAIARPEAPSFGGWLALDELGKVVLLQTSVVYFLCSLYAPAYLALHPERRSRAFCVGLLAFPGIISLHIQSHHLGLMWVGLESLTLICAPLVYFNRNARSLEATWKYLLIGSVGIALALLGSLFLAYSALKSGFASSLLFEDLIAQAPRLSQPWLHSAFVLLFVGYGTKMGLAPMHTWKPDAYGEAPGLVGTLLAGCVTSCAYLSILRFYAICVAAGEGAFVKEIMIGTGLFSMVIAGAFLARQRDFKRMLAYSSVEHMGILVLGVGIGGSAVFGALLHLINNAVTKAVLFLSAGNIQRAFGTKMSSEVHGAIRRVPWSAGLFLAGFFAITGSPPFAVFLSEVTILREAIATEQYFVAGLFLAMLIVVFIGMGATVLSIVQGTPEGVPPESGESGAIKDRFVTIAPIAAFLSIALVLGVYIPEPLAVLLRDAAAYLEVRS